MTSTLHTLSRPEARIAIYGDGAGLSLEASLPKLLYGNNLSSVSNPVEAFSRLGELVRDFVDGEIPELAKMDYLRVDYSRWSARKSWMRVVALASVTSTTTRVK